MATDLETRTPLQIPNFADFGDDDFAVVCDASGLLGKAPGERVRDGGLRSELMEGTGAGRVFNLYGALSQQIRHRDFRTFLPENFNPATDNAGPFVVTAWNWSAANGVPVIVPGKYRISTTTVLAAAGGDFIFDNGAFELVPALLNGVISNGASGPIAFHVTSQGGRFSGFGSVKGTQAPASVINVGLVPTPNGTKMVAFVFDQAHGFQDLARWHIENVAEGQMVMWCDDFVQGDVEGYMIHGQQPFGVGTAGSLRVLVGNRRCRFGSARGREIYKPLVYFSLAPAHPVAGNRDNEDIVHGEMTGYARAGSLESGICGIRSADRVRISGVFGDAGAGIVLQRYAGDEAFAIDKIRIDAIEPRIVGTSAAGNIGISLITPDQATLPIGSIAIGSAEIDVDNSASEPEWGAFFGAGTVSIDKLRISGGANNVFFGAANVHIRHLIISGSIDPGIVCGRGALATVETLTILSNPSGPTNRQIFYDPALGSGPTGRLRIGTVDYRPGAAALTYLAVTVDAADAEAIMISDVRSAPASGALTGHMWVAGEVSDVRGGQLVRTAVPTHARTPGTFVAKAVPDVAAGKTHTGWVRTASAWEPQYVPNA